MILIFTPYTYIFLLMYVFVLIYIFSTSNFYIFWLLIEILMLLFMGVSFTLFINSYRSLMLFFLVQTIASFSILVFYILSIPVAVLFSLFLKLGVFPFFSWYINVLYRFPNFIMILARTLHKLPPLYIFSLVYSNSFSTFVFSSLLFTMLFGSGLMLFTSDLRYLLILSSIVNNRFLILRVITYN